MKNATAPSTFREEPFPHIPDDLMMALDRLFPERCPDLEWPMDKVRFKAGERSVIRFLLRKHEEQNRNILKAKTN